MVLKLRLKKFKDDGRKTSKAHEKYLPPLTTKVMAPNTIYTYMGYFQKLSKAMHMDYVNITLDIGTAISAYKFLWGKLEQFSNVVIHIDDFHYLKEDFKVILLHNDDLFCNAEQTPSLPQPFFKKYKSFSCLLIFDVKWEINLIKMRVH